MTFPEWSAANRGGCSRRAPVRHHGHGIDPAGVTGEGVQLAAALEPPHTV
jgi:hypothetical protein